MKLDISTEELKEVYEFIQTLLGGDSIDVDLTEDEIRVLMRKALKDYVEQINNWWLVGNFSNVQGFNADTNFTHQFITQNPMIAQRISDWFASMARVGGKIPWKKDYFTIEDGRQVYDLSIESSIPYKHGSRRINRVLWVAKPEIMGGQFNPALMDGGLVVFGLAGLMYGPNLMAYLGNAFDVVLLAQSLETRNKILRSEFFYNLSGDIIEIFPMPGNGMTGLPPNSKVFYYYVEEEDLLQVQQDGDDVLIGNITQVKLDIIPWSELNSPSKNWIENWTQALAKYALGSKLRQIREIASGEAEYKVQFDYQSLLDEHYKEKETLLTNLKEYLESLSAVKQAENKAIIFESSAKLNKYSPRKPFIG